MTYGRNQLKMQFPKQASTKKTIQRPLLKIQEMENGKDAPISHP
jgi:hypothetical protein